MKPGNPDISTLEETGHLYFGPTPAGSVPLCPAVSSRGRVPGRVRFGVLFVAASDGSEIEGHPAGCGRPDGGGRASGGSRDPRGGHGLSNGRARGCGPVGLRHLNHLELLSVD
jgi:hypothetical protein